ncbi:MAG: spore germination protein [Clostridia bacterium]|nr:spore germination protein [Clostridia bacterium]
MRNLGENYKDNVKIFDTELRVNESFDLIKKRLVIGDGEATFYYIDGFIKDTVMQKLMMHFLSLKKLPRTAREFIDNSLPYVETDETENLDLLLQMALSGACVMLGSTFGSYGVIIDARTYPARETAEPEGDRVIHGARDGFVETLIFNTALIRRRIRDTALTMRYITIGSSSKTDLVLCYMNDRVDEKYLSSLKKKLSSIKTSSLTMGHQSLAECLIRTRWYNPFPKIRTTERPDAAAAQLLEGSVLILVDNSPGAMVLPSTIFDFMQETNDYYLPPLTGTYIKLVRYVVFGLTLLLTPLWYLITQNPELTPEWLRFVLPENEAKIPIIAQLFLVEFIIDALRLASMNTPDMLANSLSVVGGLILGDFAVDIGWLMPEVILYMAFVAIANFTQRSYELGYAFKFMRMLLLLLTALFGVWGFFGGLLLIIILLATNKTANEKRHYLYPLIPFNARALASLIFRVKKKDFEK